MNQWNLIVSRWLESWRLLLGVTAGWLAFRQPGWNLFSRFQLSFYFKRRFTKNNLSRASFTWTISNITDSVVLMIIVTSLDKNSQGPSQQVNPSASAHTFSTLLTRITGVNNANNNNNNNSNNINNNNNSGEILTEAQFSFTCDDFLPVTFLPAPCGILNCLG